MLSLALGQHAQIQQVLQNSWVEEFTIGLIRSFRAASRGKAISQVDINGVELDMFFERFSDAALGLMSPNGSSRPVVLDSTPANLFLVTPLRMLFPAAKFIHVVRDANEVIASLSDKQLLTIYKSRYVECSADEAREHWVQGARAGMDAERAFGSGVVHRVHRRDLIAKPAATLDGCFRFLNLEFDPAALRPFSSISVATTNRETAANPEIDELNAALLLSEGALPGDEMLVELLKSDLWKKAIRNGRLVPPFPGSAEALKIRKQRERNEAKPMMSRLMGRLKREMVASRRGTS